MSSSDSTSETFSDNSNGSSSSFSSLLGDNPHPTTDQTPVVTAQIPVVNIPDSEETESNFDDLSEGGKDPLVILDPCQKEELICLSNPDQGSLIPFTYIFFQVKLPTGDEIGWVSFNSIPRKGILNAYTSSYKKWKQRFFRVRGSGLMSNLLVGEDGTPHFPLFWSLEPRMVPTVKFDQLSIDKKIDVAFLRNKAPIHCGFLLENEDLPARLRQSLALRRWLKKAGVDPSAPTSDMQTAIPTNERRKKQKLDASIGNQQMQTAGGATPTKATEDVRSASQQTIPPPSNASAGNRPPPQPQSGESSSGVANQTSIPADKWWCLFNNFQGAKGSDVSSIFNYRFPIEQVVSREFSKKDDIARVNKVDIRNVGKHLMTMGMQTSFFGYCFDSALTSYDKELKEQSLMIQDLTSKLKATESATQTIASSEKSLLDTKTKLTAAETAKTTTDAKYSDLVAEQVKLKKDFDNVILEKDKGFQKDCGWKVGGGI
ncbi:hypothetical protein SESBI_42662 [Sesbania bispinosa]|nr:hypothetical protein SESBI_42662 [Sesbania bispinosa]